MADAPFGDGTLIEDPAVEAPLVINDTSFADVTETVCGYTANPGALWWYAALTVASAAALMAAIFIPYLIITCVGTWGPNNQVGWAWAIPHFALGIGQKVGLARLSVVVE